jgi:acetolactate synthase-1/2/3 large subunit
LLANAKRPIIHAGSGVMHSKAFEELETLANQFKIPVATSWAARGALCESNELSIPFIYIETNDEIKREADLVLVLGSRVSETDWWGKMPNWGGPEQKWIQVDIDENFLGRNRPLELGVQADIKCFLRELIPQLDKLKSSTQERETWFAGKREKIKKQRGKLDEKISRTGQINSATVPAICKEVMDSDAHVIFDGGNTAVWGQFYYKCTEPGAGIGTPKMGMLGAGVGQALGAQAADPNRQVYALMGDGAMGMHMQEIETAVRQKLNVIFLVFCDNQWGMVKMNQQFALKPLKTMIKKSLDETETINADFKKTDWAALAQAMGAYGATVNTAEEFETTLKTAVDKKTCSVIQINVDPVFHMWAPGLLSFKKMHEEPAGK